MKVSKSSSGGGTSDLAASKITSGTMADARIAASNVTQHQGSIVGSGALDSGSITSGFGAIDNGSSGYTTTGAAAVGTVAATQNTNGETLPIVVKNADDTADADAAVGYGFDLETTAGATVNSAKIVAKKKESFTGTASTQDAKLEFYVTKNGSEAKQLTLQGGNEMRFSNSNSSITVGDSSGDNQAGKNMTIAGGLGTGTGVPGSVSITSASPTGSGTGAHTAVTVAQFASEGPTLNYGGVSTLVDNEAVGEKVFFGTGQTVKGKLYYLNTSGAWALADTDAEASTAALIAVACGGDGSGSANDAATHGMLIRGFIDNASYLTGTYNEGIPVYVDGTAGNMTITRPTSGFVRVIGWCCATANVIYFNPDNTYLEL